MISHGKEIKMFCGNSNRKLAEDIAKHMGTHLGDMQVTHFADGECSVSLYETVRGCDVFLIQSTCNPVNDNLMELLVMIDACRRASAGRITAVMPYFGYARQDRKAKSHDPISAKLVANLLTSAGADRVLTMDLHAPQIQGFFDIPVDNLVGMPIFAKYYLDMFGPSSETTMVVSPDVGSVARSRNFAPSSTIWSIPPALSAERRRPSLRSAAPRRSTPARATPYSPAPPSSASTRAISRSSSSSIPYPRSSRRSTRR